DTKMRFIKLRKNRSTLLPVQFAEVALPEECMKSGRIVDAPRFSNFLKGVSKKYNLKYVRVSIPETQVYSFALPVEVGTKGDIRGMIELVLEDNIPLKNSESVFDYRVLSSDEKTIWVQVAALASA